MTLAVTAGGIDVTNPGTYDLANDSLDIGEVKWRRFTVDSPFVHGDFETHAVKAMAAGAMAVDVFAATAAQMQTRLSTLIDALTAGDWTLSIDVDGSATYSWLCRRADWRLIPINKRWEDGPITVTFSFMRYPVASAGGV